MVSIPARNVISKDTVIHANCVESIYCLPFYFIMVGRLRLTPATMPQMNIMSMRMRVNSIEKLLF
jgi:hypothetical protein